jgi:Amt family ammonium transporter
MSYAYHVTVFKKYLLIGLGVCLLGGWAWAQDATMETTAPAVASQVAAAFDAEKEIAAIKSGYVPADRLNIVWTLVTGFIVMFMQAGFALVETGFTRAKNCGHTMSMNFMVYSLAMLGYWVCGFAIQFGGTGAGASADFAGVGSSVSTVATLGSEVGQKLNILHGLTIGQSFIGLFGGTGFFLSPSFFNGGIFTLFLFQMVFMDTTATIPTGAMAERWKFSAFCVCSFFIGAIIYPMYGCWVWGGGWLAAMGKNWGLGHGHVDFAGSSVVHLCGGVIALVGGKMIGPRYGKYNKNGTPNAIPGHNIPMAMLGCFILAFGWFGFNPGSTLAGMDTQIGIIATNTMLAGAAGSVVSMYYTWWRFGKPDPSFMCNGLLAGLVAITAPCAFVDAWAAVLIGAISGIWVLHAALFVEGTLKIDDPVGAIAVHGANGVWGVIALGLFANGKYGAGWNSVGAETYMGKAVEANVSGGVTGLFYGDASQLLAEIIGVVACLVAVGAASWVIFAVVEKTIGHRVSTPDEIAGLDLPEMGAIGYQQDVNPESR